MWELCAMSSFSRAPLIRYALSAEDLRALSTGLVYLCRLLFCCRSHASVPGSERNAGFAKRSRSNTNTVRASKRSDKPN